MPSTCGTPSNDAPAFLRLYFLVILDHCNKNWWISLTFKKLLKILSFKEQFWADNIKNLSLFIIGHYFSGFGSVYTVSNLVIRNVLIMKNLSGISELLKIPPPSQKNHIQQKSSTFSEWLGNSKLFVFLKKVHYNQVWLF